MSSVPGIPRPHQLVELRELLAGLCDSELTPTQTTQLAEMVSTDPACAWYYVNAMQLHAMLPQYSGVGHTTSGAKLIAEWQSRDNEFVGNDVVRTVDVPETHQDKVSSGSRNSFIKRLPASRYIGLAASLLLVGYFVTVIGLLVSDRIHRAIHSVASRTEVMPPAQLTRADDAKWQYEPSDESANRMATQTLQVHTGLAEVQFAQGAKVIVQGPAEFEVRSKNSGFLHRGKLVAKVPPQAIGFTVATPTAEVVDLGTEFAVEVNANGTAEVEVLAGKVVLKYGAVRSGFGAVQEQILTAGMARQVEAFSDGRSIVREVKPKSHRFDRHLEITGTAPIAVQRTTASSEYARKGRSANNLINGSGLTTNGAHSSDPSGTMWHTELGRVKGEFVLFDLGHLHRLKAIKIWNYNGKAAELYRFRGAKQVDICVSTSGKGDPLSRPEEWKRVVSDCRLHAGTGTDSYDTPDVVPLGNTMAQFVAIVIHDYLGTDLRFPNNSQEQCVGLSEVQFFGVPADAIQTEP